MEMVAEQYANAATTTLNGSITSGATSLVVTSATPFPASPNFRILIDSEYILVTGVNGTTWTIVRGVEGSTAAAHTNGAQITHLITAAALQNIQSGNVGGISNRGMFIGSFFEDKNQVGIIMVSLDGTAWKSLAPSYQYNPSGGVRDPSLFFDGTYFWMAYTRVTAPFYKFGLAYSQDLINWTHDQDIDGSVVSGVTLAWGPEWFFDPYTGIVHIIIALGVSSTTMQLYELHPSTTLAPGGSWSGFTKLTGTSLPTDMIDPYMMFHGGTYYCFYKNDAAGQKYIEVMSSTSLTSGYTVNGSGHWMTNWAAVSGNGWEGPSIQQIDSTKWRMWVDSTDVSDNGLGYYYSDCTTASPGSGWITGANWSALTLCTESLIMRHGTVIRAQDVITLRCVVGAMFNGMNAGGFPTTIASSAGTSCSTATTTALSYTSSRDDLAMFNGSTKFTAPQTGVYLVNTYTHWATNTTGIRIVEIRKNGTTYMNGSGLSCTAAGSMPGDARQEVSGIFALNAGDYLELAAFQNSGGSLSPSGAQTFSITKIA